MKSRVTPSLPGIRMKSLPLALLVLLSSPAFAANLMEVYREAQQQDAAYASARAALEAGQEKAPQGLALLLPTASLNADTTGNRVDRGGTATDFNSHS